MGTAAGGWGPAAPGASVIAAGARGAGGLVTVGRQGSDPLPLHNDTSRGPASPSSSRKGRRGEYDDEEDNGGGGGGGVWDNWSVNFPVSGVEDDDDAHDYSGESEETLEARAKWELEREEAQFRPSLCGVLAPSLRDEIMILLPKMAVPGAGEQIESPPVPITAAWNYVKSKLPDLATLEKLRSSIPKKVHRVGSAEAISPVYSKPKEGEPIEPWAVDYLRENLAGFRHSLPDYPAGYYSGRGVVMTGGGGKHFSGAVLTFASLRKQGCRLPGELWVTLEESKVIPPTAVEVFQDYLGVNVRVIPRLDEVGSTDDERYDHYGGVFTNKVGALLLSRFKEVLFLDNDNIPISNACEMFDEEGYLNTGTMMWPDFWRSSAVPELSDITGTTGRQFPNDRLYDTHETGQLLLDKERAWRPLMLSTYFNLFGPGVYYRLLSDHMGEGDKETFAQAFLVEGLPWYVIPHDVLFFGEFRPGSSDKQNYGMVQRRPNGDPLFLHQNFYKPKFYSLPDRPFSDGIPGRTRKFTPWETMHGFIPDPNEFDKIAGYDVELWAWSIMRAIRCDEGVVDAMLALKDLPIDDRGCEFDHKWYMKDVYSGDTLLCPEHPWEQSEWDILHNNTRPTRAEYEEAMAPPPPDTA